MGISINCEEDDKLFKPDANVLYNAMDELGIKFIYPAGDYCVPELPISDVMLLIESGKVQTEDGRLLR